MFIVLNGPLGIAESTLAEAVRESLRAAAIVAMRNCARRYLAPDFSCMGAPGMAKLARSLPTWLEKAQSPANDLRLVADLMERAGTGGALFRNLYRDFLDEASQLVPASAGKAVRSARDAIAQSAEDWTAMAGLLERCAADLRAEHLTAASELCRSIADKEVGAMESLASI